MTLGASSTSLRPVGGQGAQLHARRHAAQCVAVRRQRAGGPAGDRDRFPLFRRTSRGIELTERGRTFLYDAERVIGDVLSLSDTARRLRGAPSDTLTLGMGSGMAQIFMPRLFRDLAEKLPAVQLEILTAPTKNIFNDLHEERVDAGIAIDPTPSGCRRDRERAAHAPEMALIAHPTHRLARARKPIDIGSLVSEPIIMSELTVGYGQVVLSLFADLGIRPTFSRLPTTSRP